MAFLYDLVDHLMVVSSLLHQRNDQVKLYQGRFRWLVGVNKEYSCQNDLKSGSESLISLFEMLITSN